VGGESPALEGGEIMAAVFNNIRAECARKRMTLAELTDKAGIERKTFYNWEEKNDLPLSALIKFADILKVTTDKLLGLDP
jgi:transcriptional regulator with XRE-family HTH domain